MRKEPPTTPNLSETTNSEESNTLLKLSAKVPNVPVVGTVDIESVLYQGDTAADATVDTTAQVAKKPVVKKYVHF